MAARLIRKTATLSLGDATGRIAVVADTHSRPHPRVASHLAALEPEAILHAGDIGELSVLDDLGRVAPVFAVRGNIDSHARQLPDVLTVDLDAGGRAFRILIVHIGVYGVRLRADVARMARAEKASLVVCGHSHVPFIGQDAELTVFNPGSIGPRRFSLPIVFGTIEVTRTGVRLAHIDCETGNPWNPPM
jgi:putative phosphoesterase